MKIKSDHLGDEITYYNGNYTTTFTVTEETAKEYKYYTTIGLGYLFEALEPKVKYKGVENEQT